MMSVDDREANEVAQARLEQAVHVPMSTFIRNPSGVTVSGFSVS